MDEKRKARDKALRTQDEAIALRQEAMRVTGKL